MEGDAISTCSFAPALITKNSCFYETVLDVCHARRRQRWLNSVSLGLCRAHDDRTTAACCQRHLGSCAPHCCVTPYQFSARLPLDGQQPRRAGTTTTRPCQPCRSSDNEFSGNLSLVRDCSSCSAYHESEQPAYALGCAPLLLGARRIFARGGSRIQSCAFGSLLEYSGYGYIAFPHCASLVVI
jgi:hypothetical protein